MVIKLNGWINFITRAPIIKFSISFSFLLCNREQRMFPATFPRKTNMATILQIDIDGKRALALDWLNLSAFTIYGHTNDVKTICITGKNLFESLLYAKLLKISFITTKKKNVAEALKYWTCIQAKRISISALKA